MPGQIPAREEMGESSEFAYAPIHTVAYGVINSVAPPNTCEVVANGQMKFIASVMRAATNACDVKDDKYGHQRLEKENFKLAG